MVCSSLTFCSCSCSNAFETASTSPMSALKGGVWEGASASSDHTRQWPGAGFRCTRLRERTSTPLGASLPPAAPSAPPPLQSASSGASPTGRAEVREQARSAGLRGMQEMEEAGGVREAGGATCSLRSVSCVSSGAPSLSRCCSCSTRSCMACSASRNFSCAEGGKGRGHSGQSRAWGRLAAETCSSRAVSRSRSVSTIWLRSLEQSFFARSTSARHDASKFST